MSGGHQLDSARDDAVAICDEFGIGICEPHRYPEPGETRAVETMARILRKFGEGHLRLVLTTLAETKGNYGLIDETSLWAVSDLIRACAEWIESRTSEWLEAWDRLPLGQMMYIVQELAGVIRQREALAGLAYSWLRAELDPEHGITSRTAMRELTIRMDESELDKGRPALRAGRFRRSEWEKIVLGRALNDAKRRLPRGGWVEWVKHETGLPLAGAHDFMRIAREADAGGELDEVA